MLNRIKEILSCSLYIRSVMFDDIQMFAWFFVGYRILKAIINISDIKM